jgi:hypothetical protein
MWTKDNTLTFDFAAKQQKAETDPDAEPVPTKRSAKPSSKQTVVAIPDTIHLVACDSKSKSSK